MKKILISNDDGVQSQGIQLLASRLKEFSEITVMAPDRDRSGASNSLTLDTPLRVYEQPNGFFAVNGTPTDCVHIAITGFLKQNPDMVVSGINHGANLGDDVLYSGTVAAAMEGRFLGFPAMAISLANLPKQPCQHFETAAFVACKLVNTLIENPLPKATILNVNVPDLPFDQILGIEITRLGHRHLAEPIISSLDPRGHKIYWVGPAGNEEDAGPGTDFYAIHRGFVSVTPIQVDLTDYKSQTILEDWIGNFKIL